jgi:fatty-acyl-CoA synthase
MQNASAAGVKARNRDNHQAVQPLSRRLAVPELRYIINDAAPRVLIYDVEFQDTATQLGELCALPHLVDLTGDGGDSGFERGIQSAAGAATPIEVSHDDISTIMYTSGTTGHPKGAMITHGMTFWNTVNLGIPHSVAQDSVLLTVLPLFHTAGLNCYANVVFHAGGMVAVIRNFEPVAALELLQDSGYGFTHFVGVPAHYLFMSQQPDFADATFATLQMGGVGGAPCALSILQAWADKGLPIAQGFGMTETSPAVAVLDADKAVEKAGSVGVPVLHNDVRLVDEDGNDVSEPERIGELWVKGPNVTPGYWNNSEATADSITDGWLHTGDAAKRDAEGYLYIVDRWKEMYISGGENVYPAEVENIIYELDAIAEVAVIGVPDERWGEARQAVIAVQEGYELAAADVLRHCEGRLARFKHPKSVRSIDALPRNATRKVLKRELQQP